MMDLESQIKLIRKTLRKGKKSNIFSGEIETGTFKFRYEIYGVSYDKYYNWTDLNVRIYNWQHRSWVGAKWRKKGEGWRSTESVNRSVRRELYVEWKLFFTSTFDIPSFHLGIGTIKHIKQP